MKPEDSVLVIRIKRNTVGVSIPYDKLYFFTREMRERIPQFFRFALVLPVTEDLLDVISNEHPQKHINRHFHRNDTQATGELPEVGSDYVSWWEANVIKPYALRSRVAAIPVLTRHRNEKEFPRYLASKKWYDLQERKGRKTGTTLPIIPAVSDYAYLSTPYAAPQDKIRPICTLCPRALLQLQGACLPGQLICYTNLNLAVLTGESSASVSDNVP